MAYQLSTNQSVPIERRFFFVFFLTAQHVAAGCSIKLQMAWLKTLHGLVGTKDDSKF